MTTQDYDEIEKIFNGTWNYDRDENIESFIKADEVPEEMTKLAMQEKLISFKRVGDAFEMINLLGDLEFKATVKLNESCDWKEKDEDPKFIFKFFTTFKDGVLKQEVTPLKEGEGKKHYAKLYVQDGELVAEMHLTEEPSIFAKRFYKPS